MTDIILNRDQNYASQPNSDLTIETYEIKDSGFESFKMGISEDNMGFILDVLSDISEHPGAYALREAYSNAYDATRATGDMSRKIEIIVPSEIATDMDDPAAPSLTLVYGVSTPDPVIIRDHGIGMSANDLREYFTQYGGSKKRGAANADTVGSKGLGSKAPLACADTFTVVSVKDHIKSTVILNRSANENTAAIRSEKTDEDNGTSIIITIAKPEYGKQMLDMAHQIAEWNLDANLWINGEQTHSLFERSNDDYVYLGEIPVATDADGNTVAFRMWERDESFPTRKPENIDVNLAGVRYPLVSNYCSQKADLIVACAPGYLNFPPNRDSIKDDSVKAKFITAVKKAVCEYDFSASVTEKLTSIPSMIELRDWLGKRFCFVSSTECGLLLKSLSTWKEQGVVLDGINVSNNKIFTRDGIDYSPLFAADPDNGLFQKFYAMRFDSAENRFYLCKPSTREGTPCSFERMRKSELAYNIGMQDPTSTCEMWNGHLWNTHLSDDCIIVTGIKDDSDWHLFASFEKNIRDAYSDGKSVTVTYLMPVAPFDGFGEIEAAAIPSEFQTVAFSDAIDTARKNRNVAKAKRAACYVAPNRKEVAVSAYDIDKFDTVDFICNNVNNIERVYVTLDTVMQPEYIADSVFVAGDFQSYAEHEAAKAVAALADRGLIAAKHIVFCGRKLHVSEIKTLVKNGARFVADVRNVNDRIECDFASDLGCSFKVNKRPYAREYGMSIRIPLEVLFEPDTEDAKKILPYIVSNAAGSDACAHAAKLVRCIDFDSINAETGIERAYKMLEENDDRSFPIDDIFDIQGLLDEELDGFSKSIAEAEKFYNAQQLGNILDCGYSTWPENGYELLKPGVTAAFAAAIEAGEIN